jgi:hypothetical protein
LRSNFLDFDPRCIEFRQVRHPDPFFEKVSECLVGGDVEVFLPVVKHMPPAKKDE